MELLEITQISEKLKNIESKRFQDVYDFIDLIETGNNDFELSDLQKNILDKRRLTPSDNFISKDDFILKIKSKYGV